MAGIVTATFKTTANSEAEVRELLDQAQREIDGGFYFTEGRIGHIRLVSFEAVEESFTITASELDARITDAVKAALVAQATVA